MATKKVVAKKVVKKKPVAKKPVDKGDPKLKGTVGYVEAMREGEFAERVKAGAEESGYSPVTRSIVDAVAKIVDANPGTVIGLTVCAKGTGATESCLLGNGASPDSVVGVCNGLVSLSRKTFEKIAEHA